MAHDMELNFNFSSEPYLGGTVSLSFHISLLTLVIHFSFVKEGERPAVKLYEHMSLGGLGFGVLVC